MALTVKNTENTTLISGGAVAEKLFITGAGAVCGAGARAVGVSVSEATAAGKPFGVCVVGIAIISTGGSVAVGNEVQSDAAGKAVVLDAGKSNGIVVAVGTGEAAIAIR